MYYVPRGGNRGGADQFKWEDVKEDKGRECYLGHSLMAPVGRWQKNKDLQWFSKGKAINSNSNISDEIQAARNAEREAMLIALGHKVGDRLAAETMQPQREATLPKLESARSKSAKKKKKKHKEEKRNKRKIEENHKSSHKKRKKKHRRRDSSDDTESSSENESSPDRSSESEREVSAKKRKQDGDNDRRRRESNDHRHRDRHDKNSRERDRRKRDGSRDRSKMRHHDKR